MVNAQMNNILKKNGIDIPEGAGITFSVDPYSNYISILCDEESLGKKIEEALNVGDNGKNLYKHISWSSYFDGEYSAQITNDGTQNRSKKLVC